MIGIELNEQGLPATFNPEGFDRFRGDGTERIGFGDGNGPFVQFMPKAQHMSHASLQAGKPIFKSILFVRIQHPGERDFILRPATREDVDRYPAQYRHYLDGRKGAPDGTPIAVLFPHHVDIVEMLAFHSVHTVEQLAELSDTAKQNIGMGGYEWSQKAQRYLDALAKGKGFAQHEVTIERLKVDNHRKDDQIAQLTQQLQQLTHQVATLMSSMGAAGQHMGAAPSMVAVPPALAQMSVPQDGAFMRPAPGELGADDNLPVSMPGGPAALSSPPPDGFLDQVAAEAAAPAAGEHEPRRGGRPRRQ